MIPFDGGHQAVAGYESIRTKRGRPYFRADITKLFPVAALFIAFLLAFVFAGVFSISPTRSRSRTDCGGALSRRSCRPADRPVASRWAACPSATGHPSRCSP